MLAIYITAAIIGGGLILLSLFGGEHGHESDHDADHGDGHDGSHDGPWIPFLSLRFWTYGLMGFGACGLALALLVKTPEPLTTFVASGTGIVTGLIVSWIIRNLSRADVDSAVQPSDILGKEALVQVAIRIGQLGRVRVTVKGEVLDLIASSDERVDIEAGESVVIVDLDGDRVKVVSREAIFGSAKALEEAGGSSV